jgi:hypothetical protein
MGKGRPGKEFPGPHLLFFEFSGVAVEREPGWFAPEVYDLRRLMVQPAWPIINLIKGVTSQSCSPTLNSQKKEGVWGILSPAFLPASSLIIDQS